MRAEADAAAGLTLAWSTSGSSQFVFEKSCSIGQGACVELRQTSRAVGGFALCALAPGTRVLAEKPLLTMLLEDVDDADNIIAAASELTVPDRDDFYGLCMHGVENEAEKTALGIWLSNAYPTDEEPEERGAVFRVICRLNHSCVPNCRVSWNARTQRMTVHTMRPIEANEELTVSYCFELQEGGGQRDRRQARIHHRFGFACACDLCTQADGTPAFAESERRRARLLELASRISDCPSDLIDLVEERLRLLKEEGLGASTDTIGVASAFLRFIGDEDGARTWASRAAESALLGLGDDHEEYLRWLACARGDFLEANAQQDFMMALATFNLRSDADCKMEDEDEAGD